MTTTVHKNLTGADLHEPKGADTATSGKVYVSNGAGSGVWTDASTIITNTAFTTGDLKPTHKTTADSGWILWSDSTIGDGSSGASIRANADTSALFTLYWNNFSNTICPVSTGRGVSAAADFAAHKTITLPLGASRTLGLAGSGSGLTTRGLGATTGGETNSIAAGHIPQISLSVSGSVTGSLGGNVPLASSGGSWNNASTVNISGSSGNFPQATTPIGNVNSVTSSGTMTGTAGNVTPSAFNVMNPTAYVNIMIKL